MRKPNSQTYLSTIAVLLDSQQEDSNPSLRVFSIRFELNFRGEIASYLGCARSYAIDVPTGITEDDIEGGKDELFAASRAGAGFARDDVVGADD
jgi:hypothetical protein